MPTELQVVRQDVLQRGESSVRLAERRALIHIRVAQRRQRDPELTRRQSRQSAAKSWNLNGPTMLLTSAAA